MKAKEKKEHVYAFTDCSHRSHRRRPRQPIESDFFCAVH